MRIQHNIMAMSSYRNYTNNVSAMKANLEKLSSGYKINRAGDDAAGLAISEKMRAQITGLKQAQANAKSGINLVQTAEGALQEVQDMMNRMVKLAEQSANGTYDVNVDRNQLQKEFDQLKDEINRINKSANFNGINLFGGPDDGATKTSLNDGIETYASKAVAAVYKSAEVEAVTPSGATNKITVGGQEITVDGETDIDGLLSKLQSNSTLSGAWTIAKSGDDAITFTEKGTSSVFAGATLAGATQTTEGEAGTKASGSVTLTATGDTITIDGTTIAYDSANAVETETPTENGAYKYTVSVDSETNNVTINVTAANAGTAGNAEGDNAITGTVGSDSGAKFEITGGTNGTAAVYTLSDVANALETATSASAEMDIGGKKYNVTESTLEKQLEQWAAAYNKDSDNADYTASVSADKKSITYTAKKAGAIGGEGPSKAPTGATEVTKGADADSGSKKTEVVASDKISVGTVDLTAGTDAKYNSTDIAALKAYFATGAAGEKVKVNDDITVTLAGIADAWAADAKSGEDVAQAMLNAAKGAVNLWNADEANADKGYTYGNVRISKTATGAGQGDIVAQAAGDGLYILMDKIYSKTTAGADPIGSINIQIGDTSAEYNRMEINLYSISSASIKDISEGTGKTLDDISVDTEDNAANALSALKGMVNYISDIRGELGAKQNRLSHTINNLSVMEENIQDAESTIRDVDVAEEMMAYTKNNILIQSAQAMLAQANQVPQGVLQLLQ